MTTQAQPAESQDQVKVRLDGDLKRYLKIQAVQNRRTLNGEIEFRLDVSRKQDQLTQGTSQ